MFSKGLLKVAYLKKRFALEFLNYKSNDYIETVSAYQEKFNSSRGSIQIALKELQMEKVITLHSKGASGTQVVHLDYNRLLEIVDINTIIGGMPLPYTSRQEGLAAAFVQSFKNASFRFACSYKQGSLNRIKGLMNNDYDFIILSKMASEYYKNIYDFKELLVLNENSYNGKHAWVVRKGIKEIKDGMRVGLDKSSFEQFYLVNQTTEGKKLELVDMHFPNVINDILSNNIDAAIWNVDMIKTFHCDQIDVIEVNSLDSTSKEHANSAVVITKQGRGDVAKIVKDYIKPAIIRSYQEKIMQGIIVPSF